jgi:small neutral amino acid transporter SnatA (MarC family)
LKAHLADLGGIALAGSPADFDMVFARQSGIRSTTAAETEEAEDSTDVAVFPLAIPLIAGPGAITSVILLMGQAQGDFILQTIVIALMLFVLGLCLVAFLFALPLMDRLGVTGINVVGVCLALFSPRWPSNMSLMA